MMERFNQGVAFHAHGRLAEAERTYREILARAADHVGALHLLGVLMGQTKRLEQGVELIDRALALQPDFAEAHNNRGNVLRELKRYEEALASYGKAIALKPNYADAHCSRGVVLKELGRFAEALASYDQALALRPDLVEAHNNRGNALKKLNRPEEAVASFDRAIALRPNFAEAHLNLGNLLLELNRLDDALARIDKAIELKPGFADAHNDRGNALLELQRPDDALASYNKAIALRPDFAQAYCNRGNALQGLKRLDEAVAAFDQALALKPDLHEACLHKGCALLLEGRFEEGWPLYEQRKQILERTVFFARRCEARPLWLGREPIAGKTLFVHWEQGLGDTIQFCRYLRLVEQLGARVIFASPNRLRRLFETLPGSTALVEEDRVPDEYDYYCPLMSLPLALGTSIATIPHDAPYLRAEAPRVQEWKRRLGDHGFKIGVAWQGSAGKIDLGRSFPLKALVGVSQIESVRLISLQKDRGAEQLGDLPPGMKVESLGEDYDAGADAFIDTAAIMENLDLVISPDTAVAHLAGALGRPIWLALKHVPEWRWMLDRDDSPWYPTMRLFRQAERGDWSGVFARMAHELRALASSARRAPAPEAPLTPAPRAPVSWGELIDKITILEIKVVGLAHEAARVNAQKELTMLLEVATAQTIDKVMDYKKSLKEVNESLWEIEERIREKERKSEFDEEFIALARSVYKRNDERARVKREINMLLASELVEEKSYQSKA